MELDPTLMERLQALEEKRDDVCVEPARIFLEFLESRCRGFTKVESNRMCDFDEVHKCSINRFITNKPRKSVIVEIIQRSDTSKT